MAESSGVSFGRVLREYRVAAGLTQEELAERASVSARAVSDLERGINRSARRDTARLLAGALNLEGARRAGFEALACGRSAAAALLAGDGGAGLAAATRTLPRDIGSFTGRESELRLLLAAVERAATVPSVGVFIIGGMAGVGKTAFAVHAAHQLAGLFPDGQIFLPLHGHTPGQVPLDPADALVSLLLSAGIAAGRLPPGLEPRARLWRDRVAGSRFLLVLDDASGHDQVRPLLPGAPASVVLVTSRRHLTGLEDATAISLDTLPPDQAGRLLVRLAARTGLGAAEPAVAEIARLCGYLPLAIGMLARQLHHHPLWTAADVAAELRSARDRLELMAAENLSVASAFGLSYQDLTADQQRFFRRLGLHLGADIDVYTAAALDGTDPESARRGLRALHDQYLLTEIARDRYRMHDLLREHARVLVAADPAADRDAAVGRLTDFYLHTVQIAGHHLARRPVQVPGTPEAAHLPALLTRQDATAWMGAEHLNLHAAAVYAALHDRPDQTAVIAMAMHGFLRSQGHWDQAIDLQQHAVGAARRAGDPHAEAAALTRLGDAQRLIQDYQAATTSLTQAATLSADLGDRAGEAAALSELGAVRFFAADYHAAAASYQRALELSRSTGDKLGEADALNEIGCVHYRTGGLKAAAETLTQALQLFGDLGDQRGQAHALSHLSVVQDAAGDNHAAAASLARALEIYREQGDRLGQAEVLHRLGATQQNASNFDGAAASLAAALDLYHDLASQLGQAEILNSLGDLSLAEANPPGPALALYQQALACASAIPAPFEQARALEGIGRCTLNDNIAEAATSLRQAQAIYQRAGSPNAARIQATLDGIDPPIPR